jgi:PhnB protein
MANAIPQGLHSITPQLSVDGADKAIELYRRAFGAEVRNRAPDPSGKKVWHAHLQIGNSAIFVNDVFPDMGGGAQKASLWLYVENVDAAFKRATDAGFEVKMPLMDMFWGDRTGTVTDPFGNHWNLAQHMKDLTPEQMKKAQDEFVAQMAKQKK